MTTWTNVDDLVATLRKRWKSGRFLREYAEELPWAPIELPVKSPSTDELLYRFDDAVLWAERFRRDSRTKAGVARFTVEYRNDRRTEPRIELGAGADPDRELRPAVRTAGHDALRYGASMRSSIRRGAPCPS